MKNSDLYYLINRMLLSTQAASLSCIPFIGKGKERDADAVAVKSMRAILNNTNFSATISIGEGERDKAPMLFIGEKLGLQSPIIDPTIEIAVDPLEGTTICAHDAPGSLSVIAFSQSGSILKSPDIYMDKLAISPDIPPNTVHISQMLKENIKAIADVKSCPTNEVRVCILNRPRHEEIIDQARSVDARVKLISDGDIAAVLSVINGDCDLYAGIGGAPEGILSASAISSLGGEFQGRLVFKDDEEIKRAASMGITDVDKIYFHNELVKEDSVFIATGVTDGSMLKGAYKTSRHYITESLIITPGQSQKIQSKILLSELANILK